jgi:ribosomal protein L44E
MKLPKLIKRYCKYCKKHSEQKVAPSKRGSPSTMTYGSKVRAKKRGVARGIGNRGRYSKKAITKFKMTGKKMTKKTDLRYTCKECKKTSVQNQGMRAKRVEFV